MYVTMVFWIVCCVNAFGGQLYEDVVSDRPCVNMDFASILSVAHFYYPAESSQS